ncbi:MAG TPA: hypothetical protein PLI09_15340 [Candidatus Hydrogenedentes bacterium]|nr:hypothetical protein [Candidatus Hydrogenedentota bacterium]
MKGRTKVKEVIGIIFILLSIIGLALFCSVDGPGMVLFLMFILWPLELSALGILAALGWFYYLWRRYLKKRGEHADAAVSTLRKIGLLIVSLMLGVLGVGSLLVFHLVCVELQQILELGWAIRTTSQIDYIKLACEKILTDADKKDFHSFFVRESASPQEKTALQIDWNTVMPDLLRNGRNVKASLLPEVRRKLGTDYLDPGVDGWGRPFVFSDPALTKNIVAVRSLGKDGVLSSDDILQDTRLRKTQAKFYDPGAINRTPYARLYALITGEKLFPE